MTTIPYTPSEEQEAAVSMLESGRILFGPVGSGKSYAALLYYLRHQYPKPLYVITTATKRDRLEWQNEAAMLRIRSDVEDSPTAYGPMKVDSWNNLKNYVDVTDAFFILDEQRLVGRGAWVKNFLKIAENNEWIMLSATPGDVWMDYAAVFVANGFYKSIYDFEWHHVIYKPFINYPKVLKYIDEGRLQELRNQVLVEMPYEGKPRIVNWIRTGYDREAYRRVVKDRWNVFEDKPIENVSEAYYLARMVLNADESRYNEAMNLLKTHKRLIIFYNFNYELEILRNLDVITTVGEMNGHRHDPLPETEDWVYLVQYTAGSEGWNCVETDAMLFYSLPYSHRLFHQAHGRIDRRSSKFRKLYYYILSCGEGVDAMIEKAQNSKRDFHEGAWKDLR
jgi:hypothetical protein